MSNTIIFGGSGKVARQLTRLLVAKNYTVHSVIRKEAQSESLSSLGAKPIVQSVEESSVADLAATIRSSGATTVVWSAGAGGGSAERTKAVDQEGAIKSMDASAAAGVKRFIMISAIDTRDKENRAAPVWYDENDKKASDSMWDALGTYMRAKLAADTELRTGNTERGLDYTIIRPGTLSEEPATGAVNAGKVHFGAKISREDVAAVVVACMENKGTVGMAFDVVGGTTSIEDAIRRVVDEKADTFEGLF